MSSGEVMLDRCVEGIQTTLRENDVTAQRALIEQLSQTVSAPELIGMLGRGGLYDHVLLKALQQKVESLSDDDIVRLVQLPLAFDVTGLQFAVVAAVAQRRGIRHHLVQQLTQVRLVPDLGRYLYLQTRLQRAFVVGRRHFGYDSVNICREFILGQNRSIHDAILLMDFLRAYYEYREYGEQDLTIMYELSKLLIGCEDERVVGQLFQLLEQLVRWFDVRTTSSIEFHFLVAITDLFKAQAQDQADQYSMYKVIKFTLPFITEMIRRAKRVPVTDKGAFLGSISQYILQAAMTVQSMEVCVGVLRVVAAQPQLEDYGLEVNVLTEFCISFLCSSAYMDHNLPILLFMSFDGASGPLAARHYWLEKTGCIRRLYSQILEQSNIDQQRLASALYTLLHVRDQWGIFAARLQLLAAQLETLLERGDIAENILSIIFSGDTILDAEQLGQYIRLCLRRLVAKCETVPYNRRRSVLRACFGYGLAAIETCSLGEMTALQFLDLLDAVLDVEGGAESVFIPDGIAICPEVIFDPELCRQFCAQVAELCGRSDASEAIKNRLSVLYVRVQELVLNGVSTETWSTAAWSPIIGDHLFQLSRFLEEYQVDPLDERSIQQFRSKIQMLHQVLNKTCADRIRAFIPAMRRVVQAFLRAQAAYPQITRANIQMQVDVRVIDECLERSCKFVQYGLQSSTRIMIKLGQSIAMAELLNSNTVLLPYFKQMCSELGNIDLNTSSTQGQVDLLVQKLSLFLHQQIIAYTSQPLNQLSWSTNHNIAYEDEEDAALVLDDVVRGALQAAIQLTVHMLRASQQPLSCQFLCDLMGQGCKRKLKFHRLFDAIGQRIQSYLTYEYLMLPFVMIELMLQTKENYLVICTLAAEFILYYVKSGYHDDVTQVINSRFRVKDGINVVQQFMDGDAQTTELAVFLEEYFGAERPRLSRADLVQ